MKVQDENAVKFETQELQNEKSWIFQQELISGKEKKVR